MELTPFKYIVMHIIKSILTVIYLSHLYLFSEIDIDIDIDTDI